MLEDKWAQIPYIYIMIYCCFLLFYLFLKGGLENKFKLMGRVNIGLSIALFSFSVNLILKALNIHYNINPFIFEKILFIIAAFGATLAVLFIEPIIHPARNFTIIGSIVLILFIFIPPDSYYIIIPGIGSSVYILVIMLLIRKIIQNIKEVHTRTSYSLAFSTIIAILGIIFNLQILKDFLPGEISHNSYIFIIIGFLGIYYSFKDINVFLEADWLNFIDEIFIVRKDPFELLFYFEPGKEGMREGEEKEEIRKDEKRDYRLMAQMDQVDNNEIQLEAHEEDILHKGIIGINSLLREIQNSILQNDKNLSKIELGNKTLFLEHDENVLICLISEKSLLSYKYLLKRIKEKWNNYSLKKIADLKNEKAKQIIHNSLERLLYTNN